MAGSSVQTIRMVHKPQSLTRLCPFVLCVCHFSLPWQSIPENAKRGRADLGWWPLLEPCRMNQGTSAWNLWRSQDSPMAKGGMDGVGVSYEYTNQRSRLSVLPLSARPSLHVTCSHKLLIDEFSLPLPSTHSSFIYQQYLAAETHTLDSEAFWDISSPPKIPWLPLLLSGDTTDRAFQSLELKLPLPWKSAHDLSFLISNDDKTTLDCSLWDVAGGNMGVRVFKACSLGECCAQLST